MQEGMSDEMPCAVSTVTSLKAGFAIKDGKCELKTLVSPTLFAYDSKVRRIEGKVSIFRKLPNVEGVAQSLGFDTKVEFPIDGSVRYYKRFKIYQPAWKCERMCLNHQGTLPLLYTKEHVEQFGSRMALPDKIALGLRFYRWVSNIYSHWLDGSTFFEGTILEYQLCIDDVKGGWKEFGIFESRLFDIPVVSIWHKGTLFSSCFEKYNFFSLYDWARDCVCEFHGSENLAVNKSVTVSATDDTEPSCM